MAKGIIYYKLKNHYDDADITKDCGLSGTEVDSNFNILEGRDVKSVSVINGELTLTLYSGKTFTASVLEENDYISNLAFDKESGVLSYTQNGEEYKIRGFASIENNSIEVASDETLSGKGTSKNPLGIANLSKTGTYRPVNRIVDFTRKDILPKSAKIGERLLTCEAISDYGYLYDYDGVRNIACDLKAEHSGWRIPTKEDWDDMLNAVEPCEEDRNHGSFEDNRNLGRWAGKLLKSKKFWTKTHNGSCHNDDDTCIDYGEKTDPECNCGQDLTCSPAYCGEYSECEFRPHMDNSGVDKYWFTVTPAGFADDSKNYLNFKNRAYFWTSKHCNSSTAYTKSFDYNRSTVHQEILGAQNHLSLRLVKDYSGANFNASEQILDGNYPCVLMPSMESGSKVWTSINFASANKKYHGLKPNDGAGVTHSLHFYINEYTPKGWVRVELQEGESVVVIDAPMGLVDEEYRVVDGKLVAVNEMVKQQVTEVVSGKIAKLSNALKGETDRAMAAEEDLQSQITEMSDKVENAIGEVGAVSRQLSTEIDERKAADEALQTEIDTLKDSGDASIQEVKDALEAETEERKEADDNLQKEIDAINGEISNINGDITSLQGDVKDIFDGATQNDTIAFDPETGVLTSQTFEGVTNIVQFSFNFGTF